MLYMKGNAREIMPIYSDLQRIPIDLEYNITVVNMMMNVSLFDYCNLTSYSIDGVARLLEKHGIGSNDAWMGYYSEYNLLSVCSGRADIDLSWSASCALYWWPIMSYYIQECGARGYLISNPYFSLSKYLQLPYSGVEGNVYSVYGKPVHIFGAFILKNDDRRVRFESMLNEAGGGGVVVTRMKQMKNPLEAVLEEGSLYRILHWVVIMLGLGALVDSVRLTVKYLRTMKGSLPFTYCTIALLIVTIGNIATIAKGGDLSGFLGIYPFIVSRSLYSISAPLQVCGRYGDLLHVWRVLPPISF
jgi:hypothetical protein